MNERLGRLLVIEGLDGSGKATQTQLLQESLTARGFACRKISFPDYQHKSSTLVQMYLAGEIGSLEQVNVYAASSFYAADRYISYATDWQKDYLAGRTVLADRYVTSNAAHQMSRLPREQWEEYLSWMEEYEYKRLGLPRPDLVLYLDMCPAVSRLLLEKRYGGDESRRDIHERNAAYLEKSRGAALFAAQQLGWQVIPCDDGAQPFSPGMIQERILAFLENKVLDRQ
ncbi:deoxynucleoside kinase [Oscillospiraceae bacterium MB08-C2-2]|nr:deoxynucleoside kinase [Oscillospiraceae bacterium MB08-C2-2]